MKHWIYPANPKLFDVIAAFTQEEEAPWPVSSKVEEGDFVYIYSGVPYKQILFKCLVVKTGLPSEAVMEKAEKYIKTNGKALEKSFMLLKTTKQFATGQLGSVSFDILKQNGLKGSIMGPQCLENNPQLFSYLKEIEMEK